jgi:hypothetical protein
LVHEILSWLALSDDTVEFNGPLVVGTFILAPSIWSIYLDEVYTLLLRIWVEVMEANKKFYTWI